MGNTIGMRRMITSRAICLLIIGGIAKKVEGNIEIRSIESKRQEISTQYPQKMGLNIQDEELGF